MASRNRHSDRRRRAADAEQRQRPAILDVVGHRNREDRDERQQETADKIDAHVGERQRDVHVVADLAHFLVEVVDLERRHAGRAASAAPNVIRIDPVARCAPGR